MRLQDPRFSRLVLVALAETTPVAEAAELQEDLRRAGIEPFGWVLNASLAGQARPIPCSTPEPGSNAPSWSASGTWLAGCGWLRSTPTWPGKTPPTRSGRRRTAEHIVAL